jgi:hypothetical protein
LGARISAVVFAMRTRLPWLRWRTPVRRDWPAK